MSYCSVISTFPDKLAHIAYKIILYLCFRWLYCKVLTVENSKDVNNVENIILFIVIHNEVKYSLVFVFIFFYNKKELSMVKRFNIFYIEQLCI